MVPPTHEELSLSKLPAMANELEELADGAEEIELSALVELAEDRGRSPGQYLAAMVLATDLKLAPTSAKLTVRACAGTCQRWGAIAILDHLVERGDVAIVPATCLDRCDAAPACEIIGEHGKLVVAPATKQLLDESLTQLS